jgi:hypothetical protein
VGPGSPPFCFVSPSWVVERRLGCYVLVFGSSVFFVFFLPSGRCISVHLGPSSLNIMMRSAFEKKKEV